jgi:desulfoferrodoxin-like iron-binding protein
MVGGLAAAAVSLPALRALGAEPTKEGYQVPKDPANLTPLEQVHWPKLSIREGRGGADYSRLMIQIGQEIHPMTAEHHIEWVEVWAGGKKLAHTDFAEPTAVKPVVSVAVVAPAGTELTVRTKCNLHGLWENMIKM